METKEMASTLGLAGALSEGNALIASVSPSHTTFLLHASRVHIPSRPTGFCQGPRLVGIVRQKWRGDPNLLVGTDSISEFGDKNWVHHKVSSYHFYFSGGPCLIRQSSSAFSPLKLFFHYHWCHLGGICGVVFSLVFFLFFFFDFESIFNVFKSYFEERTHGFLSITCC